MNNQVIIITGASSGFGRVTPETLAQHGHTVYVTVRDMTGKNQSAARACHADCAEAKPGV